MSRTTCGYLWLPAATSGYLWLPVATCGYLWLPVATCGYLRLPVTICGYLWLPVAACGYLWNLKIALLSVMKPLPETAKQKNIFGFREVGAAFQSLGLHAIN